jgi:sugar phosphate isomerase/epimerase
MKLERQFSRRELLKSAGFLMMAGCSSRIERGRIPIGVQLYCVREELEVEMEPTLESLAEMGFEGVEFADYFNRSAKELRRLLDNYGLKCCGTHILLDDMLGENLKATAEFNQEIGNQYLIVRWLDENRRNSEEAFAETIGLFNEISENLEPYGMRVGYHNHDYIFDSFNGESLWNILADEAHPSVILQLDTGNASLVGVNVYELLERNAGRTTTIHLKPFSSKNPDAFIGEDELDWQRIIQLCETTAGTEWYIVEYEKEAFPPLEALKANLDRFKALL